MNSKGVVWNRKEPLFELGWKLRVRVAPMLELLSSIANTWTISDDAGRTWAGPGTSSKNRLWSIPFEVQIISVGVTVEI